MHYLARVLNAVADAQRATKNKSTDGPRVAGSWSGLHRWEWWIYHFFFMLYFLFKRQWIVWICFLLCFVLDFFFWSFKGFASRSVLDKNEQVHRIVISMQWYCLAHHMLFATTWIWLIPRCGGDPTTFATRDGNRENIMTAWWRTVSQLAYTATLQHMVNA